MPLKKELLVASAFPEVFLWSSSGLPVEFQCVSIMQIDTGSPLEHYWVLASASVVPVASRCTCGSSGLQVCSNYANNTGSPLEHHWELASASVVPVAVQWTYGSSDLPVRYVQWYPSVLSEPRYEVIRSGHFQACNPLCMQLVWWELFELNWFHLTCNPKYTTNYNGAHIKDMHWVILKYSHVLGAELVSISEQLTPSKSWIYRDLSTCWLVSRHLVISNWHG